ncbi:MAG: hypothetical protein JWO73_757 [Candidatus Taylorbacteria bacterium]|nr:hypothetical protein [Candidatus Taylorbacteria bacterium]
MQALHCSHYLFSVTEIWAQVFVLYMLLYGVQHPMRFLFKGIGYNVAWSASIGDIALLCCILMGASTMQKNGIHHQWLASGAFHALAITGSMLLGIVVQGIFRQEGASDRYHTLFIVPLLMYLSLSFTLLTLLEGTAQDKIWTALLVLFWIALCAFDWITGRIDQPKWWKQVYGVTFGKEKLMYK